MLFVVDANILIAALIKAGSCRKLLVEQHFSFIAPSYVIEEILDHCQVLEEKTGLGKNVILLKINELVKFSNIVIAKKDLFNSYIAQAKEISPDPDDAQYFALALKLKCAIWSEDKVLKKQTVVKILNTKALLEEIKSK